MSSDANANASSSGTAAASPIQGGSSAPLSLEAILLQARSVAANRATPSAQGQQAVANANASAAAHVTADVDAAPASPLAAAASDSPTYASAADSKADAAAHNVGEKGTLKGGRASLMASAAPGTGASDSQTPRPSAGKRVPKNKSDDRNRSRTEMAVDNAIASDPNLSDDLSLHIVELKFFYQMSLVQIVAGLLTAVLSIYVASTGNSRAAGLIVTGLLATITAVFARTAGTSILGRELSEGQKAMLAKLQLNTYELLFAYMYSSVILAVLSLSFALGELSLNDNLLGVAGLFLFCVLCIGTMLAVRSLSLKVVLHYSFQFLNLLFLLFGYAIIFLAGWAYKKNILSRYTANANAWFAASIVVGVSTVLISFWGILASRRRSKRWLLSYAVVLSVLLAGVLAAAIGVYTNDSIVDDAVNQNCANILGDMADTSVQDELGCVKYSAVGDGAADTCPVGFATTVWETSASTQAADADTIRFGCINQQCCTAIKEYIHSNGRYLYLMALLGLVFGIAAVVAALYQRQMLRAGIKSDSMPNQEFYIMLAMTVLTVVCIVATPVAISTVSVPKLVPTTVDNNAALVVASDVSLSGCGRVTNATLLYPTASISACVQASGGCYLSVIIESQAADVTFPPHSDLHTIAVQPLAANGLTQRIQVSGLASEINTLFDGAGSYGLYFCPFCLVTPTSQAQFFLTLTYAGLNGAPAPAYGPWQDTVRVTTTASQNIVGVVKDGNTQVDTPLPGVGVRYEMYGQQCQQIGAAVTTGADGRFTLPVPIPSVAGNNGLAATVIFKHPNALYAEERVLVSIGGPSGGQPALVPAVVLYPAPVGEVNEQLCASNNGGCDVLTRCVPQSLTARYCTHCPAGYSGNADLQQANSTGCRDINECTAYPNGNCDPLTVCTNLPGTYNCSDCAIGANGQPTGYYGNGKTGCIDINECATNNGGFAGTFTCINTPGGHQQGPCIFGYTTTYPAGVPTCTNVNECEVGNGPCAPGVACTDFAPTPANDYKRFSCGLCPAGTSGDGFTCAPLNPCALNNGGCSQNPLVQCNFDGTTVTCGDGQPNNCPHQPNPFDSSVDLGFYGDGRTCTDIDECVVAPDICPLVYSMDGCVNDFGFFVCYDTSMPAPAPQCETVETGNGGCDVMTTCTAQAVGNPVCGYCPSTPTPGVYPARPVLDTIERPFLHTRGDFGAQPGLTSGKCQDVDECQYSPCDPLAICVNKSPASLQSATTPGLYGTYDGFTCACGPGTSQYQGAGGVLNANLPNGYRASGTSCTPIPACASTCDPVVSCTITNGQPVCGPCPAGYVGSGSVAGGGCHPFNSCAVNNGGCSVLTTCNNATNPNTCNPCPAGFTSTDGAKTCVDVNECLSGNGQCDPLTRCVNTAGSRSCSACPPGYAGNGDLTVSSQGCVDVNECAVNNGGCDPLTTCLNAPGNFTCGPCPQGYNGHGFSGCHLVNQCAESAPCSPHTTCVVLPGPPATFECGACDPRCYRADSPRRNIGFNDGCVPLADCNDGNNGGCPLSALCVVDLQTNSSCPAVRCDYCPPGYTGVPPTCNDVNECATNNGGCSAHATCNNTVGSRTCTCDQYYGGNPYQQSPPGCQTFGCDATHNPCYQNAQLSIAATCTDVPPAQCGPCPLLNGVKILEGNGITCTDYNECTDPALQNGDCAPDGQCYNQYLSPRTCQPCDAPYQTGTGTRTDPCVDVNECATNNGGCAQYSKCTNVVYDRINNPGVGRTCGACPLGYVGSGYTTCTPGDVCNPNPCGAFSTCTPLHFVGVNITAQCGCIADYERLPGATDCTPIQKCAAGYVRPGCNPATPGAVCSYCDPLSTCAQAPGSPIATCTSCGAGFTAGASGYMSDGGCAQFNINECTTGADNCDPSVTCTDVVPSLANGRQQFACSDCQPPGYEPGPGYGSCTSHDFCADPTLTNGGCSPHATCQNTRGSRTCTCNTAQGWVGDGITCVPDPTLCDAAHNPCDDLVTCTAGSPNPAPVVCGPCPAHYVGSGYLSLGGCSLADECGRPNNGDCACNTTCTMHPTGRTCDFNGVQNACPTGWQGDGSFGGCSVIDRCTPNPCGAGNCYMSAGDMCNAIPPAPYCVCPPGYEGNITTGCIDIDECTVYAAINGGCSDHAQCVNVPGTFQCLGCNPGYCGNPYSRGADSCANVNECAGQTCTGNNGPCVCSPHATCTDLAPVNVNDPGYSCSVCAPGWKSNRADNTGTGCNSCDNINECATNNGGCSLQPFRACTDKVPLNPGDAMYECDPCGPGWTETVVINGAGDRLQSCVDVDECQLVPGVCDPLTTCANSPGSYSCSACPCGMTSDSGDGKTPCRDINECALPVPHSLCPATYPFCFTSANVPNAVAVVSSVCINGVRPADTFPFRCGPCPSGYGPIGPVDDGINCANINECATNNGGCAASENCVDTVGSRNCVCASGYEPAPGGGCQPINACLHGFCASGGDAPSTCTPTGPNTATCACPAVGFSGTGYAGSPCTNINECATNHGGCDAHATCTDKVPVNGDPTHVCGACPAGYDGVGNVPGGCTPHNPCTDPSPANGGCDPLTVCTQTGPNTRSCSDCPAPPAAPNTTQVFWYTKVVNGAIETCVDINECATANGGCWNGYNGAQGGVAAPAVTCTNYAPTPANHLPPYVCGACPAGWTGDPTNCQDVNECLLNNGDCTANSNCVNTLGSRNCVCIDGFTMTGGVCVNINECVVTPSVCSQNPLVTCTDLTPSVANNWQKFECGPCPTGYSGTGVTCTNVNECATNNGGCSTIGGSVCSDTIGNFTCSNCLASLGYNPKPGYTPCEPIQWCTQSNGGCDPVVTCTQNGVGPNPTAAGVVCGICPQPYFQPVAGNGLCPDVNECATANGGCPTNPLVLCHNERGAPQWCDRCPPGFVNNTSSGSLTCDDINECLTSNGGCEQVCTNTPGSRRCSCNSGFTLNTDNTTCADVNECATGNGGCSSLATCANTIGSRTCTCWVGTSGNGVSCVNINECLYNNGNCTMQNSQPYAICADQTPTGPTNGPFRTCTCPSGTAGSGVGDGGCVVTDVNECATNNGGCDQNAKCTRVGNSHTCACRPGYTGSGQAGTCVDVNECATNNGGCSRYCTPAVQCFNLAGSFYCGTCPSGYTGDGYTCVDINECATNNGGCYDTCTNTVGSYSCSACPAGTTGNGKTCTDINECRTNNGGCFAGAVCTNLVPSRANGYQTRSCSACPTGYSGPGVVFPPQTGAQQCADVNECAASNGGCFAGVQCTNTVGSRICGSCPDGYTGNGVTCTDINECKTNNGGCSVSCRPAVQCTNYPGGFSCGNCPEGYQGNPYVANGCTDINECKLNNGGCGQYRQCTNTEGSWDCGPCPAGTIASGSNCIDVNECATGNGGCYSAAGMKCFNTFGSYFCAYQPSGTCPNGNCESTFSQQIVSCPTGKCQACPPGFWGNGRTCTDINECATSNGGCPTASVCTNTAGSRDCSCPTGYRLVGNTCTNVNECATNNGGCDPATACYDSVGGRTCGNCPAGYLPGNGASPCVDVNECATSNGGCSTNPLVRCTNTRGSRTCAACPSGYTGDGRTCVDINECACNNGGCRGTCTNTPGSYECSQCPGPWWWPNPDRYHCALVNECATNNGGCDPRAQCYDTGLSIIGFIIPYYCGPCPSGFTGSGYLSGGGCVDVNECRTNNGGCFARGADKSTCTNTIGSRTCGACPAGYDGDGINCVQRNTASAITVKVVSATTGLPIPNAIVRMRANTLHGRCLSWDDSDSINGLAGRTYLDRDDYPHGSPAYSLTTNTNGVVTFNQVQSGGWSIESNGAKQPRLVCLLGCSPFDWCHTRCLWCDASPTGFSHGFKYINVDGRTAATYLLALSPTDLFLGQVRIVLSWDTPNNLNMHLTYATSSQQCDVSTVLAGTNCATTDIVREQRDSVDGRMGVETYRIAVPRTTTYQVSVQNASPAGSFPSIYDTGATVSLYIGWGWWGSSWPYVMLPVAGADPAGQDASRTKTYWAVYCAREYSWSGFAPLNSYSTSLDWSYSRRGRTNTCPILRR